MLAQREITMRDVEQFVCAVADLAGATVYHVEVSERIYATYELCVWDDAGTFKQKFYADYPLSFLKYGNTYRAMNAATALCADIYQWARREGGYETTAHLHQLRFSGSQLSNMIWDNHHN